MISLSGIKLLVSKTTQLWDEVVLSPISKLMDLYNFLGKNGIMCIQKFLHVNVLMDPLLHLAFLL